MTRLVAHASAILDLLSGAPRAAAIRTELAAVAELDVPEHVHVEAISALRGLLRRRNLSLSGQTARWICCLRFVWFVIRWRRSRVMYGPCAKGPRPMAPRIWRCREPSTLAS